MALRRTLARALSGRVFVDANPVRHFACVNEKKCPGRQRFASKPPRYSLARGIASLQGKHVIMPSTRRR